MCPNCKSEKVEEIKGDKNYRTFYCTNCGEDFRHKKTWLFNFLHRLAFNN